MDRLSGPEPERVILLATAAVALHNLPRKTKISRTTITTPRRRNKAGAVEWAASKAAKLFRSTRFYL